MDKHKRHLILPFEIKYMYIGYENREFLIDIRVLQENC